jgi:hypothetical protein
MNPDFILIDPKPLSQQENLKDHFNGLRILARMIARKLLAKSASHLNKDMNKDPHDTQI